MSVPDGRPYATLSVLVADDDDDMRAYITRCLTLFGVGRVLQAADGQEALDLAPAADLVISDLVMPVVDGETLCRKIQERQSPAPLVLLISGESRAASAADGYLRKPFNATDLRVEVARLVGPPERPASG